MQSIRQEVAAKMRSGDQEGITAARLKRMSSIRKKLRILRKTNLNQIQDLGGCRAILPTMDDVRTLVRCFKGGTRHIFHNEKDYIEDPKPGGYRCHHLIYRRTGDGEKEFFNGRKIEIQIRTRLQHAWATAVEAVGLFRNEDLKGGNGASDWLRLFDLISSEFALAEGCPESKHVPESRMRVREIRELDKKLNAIQTLENLRLAFRQTGPIFGDTRDRPSHYRIDYDYEQKTVAVTRHSLPLAGIDDNDKAEQAAAKGDRSINTVYIEADKIEDLKAAYPNYFGDVQVFNYNLKNLTLGKGAIEFTQAPKTTIPPPPKEPADFSWLRPGKHRKWAELPRPPKKPKNP
jgi:hypothetical protein